MYVWHGVVWYGMDMVWVWYGYGYGYGMVWKSLEQTDQTYMMYSTVQYKPQRLSEGMKETRLEGRPHTDRQEFVYFQERKFGVYMGYLNADLMITKNQI